MPASIDRLGRATEWGARYFILKTDGAKKDMEKYLNRLKGNERKRALTSAKKSAELILKLSKGKKIIDVIVVGEESKRKGVDYDVMVFFEDGTKVGYSLKTYKGLKFNVRNPTLSSFCKQMTGKSFEDYLTEKEKKEYLKKGILYSQRKIESKIIGEWGAEKLLSILEEFKEKDEARFRENLLKQLRYGTNLIGCIVDKNGNFVRYVTRFPKILDKIKNREGKIRLARSGISVSVSLDGEHVCDLVLYMESSSKRLGKKLRMRIDLDFRKIDKI